MFRPLKAQVEEIGGFDIPQFPKQLMANNLP